VTAPPGVFVESALPIATQSQLPKLQEAKKTTDTPSAQVHQSNTDDHTYILPTKAEAISEGGQSGQRYNPLKKTNYKTLLKAIDKYHALIKKRATYTAFDSLEMRKNQKNKGVKQEESIGTHEHIEATLAQNKYVALTSTKILQKQELSTKELNSKYIEAAIHGGLSLDDVAELVVAFPKKDPPELWGQEYIDKFHQKYPNIKITYKPA
jgi:hypothetical protein